MNRISGWRSTRRTIAIAVALLCIAAPAGASVIVQNFMQAEIASAPACFMKIDGQDTIPGNTTLADLDEASTSTDRDVTGTELLEEHIRLEGQIGDRVIFTDIVRYVNNCAEPIDVLLTSAVSSGDWTDMAAEIWISNVANPVNMDPNVDVLADEWNNTAIVVANGGAVAPAATGVVTVPSGSEIQGAFVVSTGVGRDVAPPLDAAELIWTAQATINT